MSPWRLHLSASVVLFTLSFQLNNLLLLKILVVEILVRMQQQQQQQQIEFIWVQVRTFPLSSLAPPVLALLTLPAPVLASCLQPAWSVGNNSATSTICVCTWRRIRMSTMLVVYAATSLVRVMHFASMFHTDTLVKGKIRLHWQGLGNVDMGWRGGTGLYWVLAQMEWK